MAKLYEIDDVSEEPGYSSLSAKARLKLGKRRGKQLKKRGMLYEGVDFSGSPTQTPVDMLGNPQKHGEMARRREKMMSRRRKSLLSALRDRNALDPRTFLDSPGQILVD